MKKTALQIIGWREWVTFPDLGKVRIKAKVDTGARSSSLHAFNVRLLDRDGVQMVSFEIHPFQRSEKKKIRVEAPLVEMRKVRSSGGHESLRPVIETEVEMMGERWMIELTLASRDEMGFRMLLGRQAIRGRFLVNAGRSFFGGKPKKGKKKVPGKRKRLSPRKVETRGGRA